ncbi:MAG: glycoside hydrolase family 76 protein [Acidimicrobiales bacterium]
MDANGHKANADRAARTYEALLDNLYDRRTRLFRRSLSRLESWPEGLWPFANAWTATCAFVDLDPSGRDDLDDRLSGLLAYHRSHAAVLESSGPLSFESHVTPPIGSGGDVYYDDNEWVALAMLHQQRITGDSHLVTLAERVFAFITTGWWQDERLALPGGVRWAVPESKMTRNACSTAPAIEIASLLYEKTRDPAYLDWARRAYGWMVETLRGNDDLFADRIDPNGTVHPERWSYNQGSMIGAGVVLHRVTGEQSYLDDAQRTAKASLSWLGKPGVIDAQGPPLFAIYLRNLLLLPGIGPESGELAVARSYADRWWEGPGHRRDSLFERENAFVNPTAGMVTVYAVLAGGSPHP